MKIDDKSKFVRVKNIELMPGVSIKVNSLPFGFDAFMEERIPSPVAPMKTARDRMGQPIKKKGGRPGETEMIRDEDDPEYTRLKELATQRQLTMQFYHGTKYAENIAWDAAEQEPWPEFYDKIRKEIIAADIGMGYMMNLIKEITILSGIDKGRVEEVMGDFLSEETSEADTELSGT